MGLISDELYESLKTSCHEDYIDVDPNNLECSRCMKRYHECVSGINKALIQSLSCNVSIPKPSSSEYTRRRYLGDFPDTDLSFTPSSCYKYRLILSIYWANDENVRRALHVVKGSIRKWVRCNWDLPYVKDIENSIPYHMNNSIKGYRSLIYSGDHDINIPFLGTQAWIRSLNFSVIDDWRPWKIDGQVAGYTRTYANNMTFATIKGGGHTAEYTPEKCSVMFQRWVSFKPL
ncbi:PREDICTED: serine carboxypeptidase-like 18 [Tarenaya hassleriana]|uniref:serine carboxypeptidase-like 18 n=1 Tax=Tarenaya hassleriana TaxID=28532 RepID=UPI0008FD3BB0|nr:PREDICTED: serine carboxypeptidase-like 18 [Tarenaya hassleriana]